jgi:hypothetical protein
MIPTPDELFRTTQVRHAEYKAEAEQARLLSELKPPSNVRRRLALLLYGLAERLAPEVARFNQTRPV